MNHRLGRAPGHAGGRRCIEAVFEYVEVKRAQIHHAIVVQGVIDAVELESLVSLEDFLIRSWSWYRANRSSSSICPYGTESVAGLKS